MTNPPETLGTQYANFTRSGSAFISGTAKVWLLVVGVEPSLTSRRAVDLVIPFTYPFGVSFRCSAMLPFGLPMVDEGAPLIMAGLSGLVLIGRVVAILKIGATM